MGSLYDEARARLRGLLERWREISGSGAETAGVRNAQASAENRGGPDSQATRGPTPPEAPTRVPATLAAR